MNDEVRARELYRLGLHCEELKHQGCAGYCGNCQFNVALYTNSTDAVMIKAAAQIDAGKKIARANYEQTKNVVLLIIVLALIGFGIYQCKKPDPKVAETPVYVTDSMPAERPRHDFATSPMEAIAYAANNLRDVNNDGLYNCIDYAVLFHEAMPSSRIIRNENFETGWHHLFNQWGSVYIEPNSHGKYYFNMDKVWGTTYNRTYNKDETSFWEKYCRW